MRGGGSLLVFTVAFGLRRGESEGLIAELRRTASLYPQLDHSAAWHREFGDGVVIGAVGTPTEVAAPREYVHVDPDELVLFDGLPLDPANRRETWRASVLASAWDQLPAMLEGRFVAIRVRRQPLSVELINDAFGAMQVYHHDRSGASIVSNSAGLVARAIGATAEDPLGVSTFLALEWVGGDRTLRRGVHVAPGAQHWTWRPGQDGWARRRYWTYTDAGPPVRPVDDALAARIGDEIGRFAGAAAAVNGTINSPLTGGMDSRMTAAVLTAKEIPAEYWTKGTPESEDVTIALEVARRYGLPHRLAGRPTEPKGNPPTTDLGDWEARVWEWVTQNDGLPSLFLIGNIIGQPARVDRLAVTISAICAESTRAGWAQDYLDGPGTSLARAMRYLPYAWAGLPRGPISGEAYQLARTHMRDLLVRLVDEGVPLANLSVVSYLDERCRRYHANMPRELAQTEDKVLPYLTRPYLNAALSTDPRDRLTNQAHLRVMRLHMPGSESEPTFDSHHGHGRPRIDMRRRIVNRAFSSLPYPALRALTLARERVRPTRVEWPAWTPYDEATWLEEHLDWARSLALDQPNSPTWSYLDRPMFERLLDPRTDRGLRRLHQLQIYAALTIFQYEEVERRLAG